jgi:hypothetical protein
MRVVGTSDTRDPVLCELFTRFEEPSCLGYHFPAYGRVLDAALGDRGIWLVALEADRAVGCLPLRRREGPLGSVVNALPFFGPNGAVLTAPGSDAAVVREALLTAFSDVIRGGDVVSASLYTPFLEDPARLTARLRPDEVVDKFTQYLPLAELPSWPRRRRRDLARAGRAGLRVRAATPADAEAVLATYTESCAVAGVPPKPAAWLRGVLDLAAAEPRGPVRFAVAEGAGEIVAGLVTLRGPRTASYAVPFSRSDALTSQPGALLVDDAVRAAVADGLCYWNFESSPRAGDPVFEYKRGWGARVARYAVLCFYPRGRARLESIPREELRAAYPHYFVMPIGQVGGAWEPGLDVDS